MELSYLGLFAETYIQNLRVLSVSELVANSINTNSTKLYAEKQNMWNQTTALDD